MNPGAAAFALILKQRQELASTTGPQNSSASATNYSNTFTGIADKSKAKQASGKAKGSKYYNQTHASSAVSTLPNQPPPPPPQLPAPEFNAYMAPAMHAVQPCPQNLYANGWNHPPSALPSYAFAYPPAAPWQYASQSIASSAGYHGSLGAGQNKAQISYLPVATNQPLPPPTPPPLPPPQPPVCSPSIYYCDSCEKEFTLQSAYDTHCASHETCTYPGCTFVGTRKVVNAHYHGAHGMFSGTGYKTVDVEGQKFRVLMGVTPEEVAQWRADRRRKFPTISSQQCKEAYAQQINHAGGLVNQTMMANSNIPGSNGTTCRKRGATTADGRSDANVANNVEKEDEEGSGIKRLKTVDEDRHHKNANELSVEDNSNDMTPVEGGILTTTTTTTTTTTSTGNKINSNSNSNERNSVSGNVQSQSSNKRRCIHFSRGRCTAEEGKCPYSHDFTPRICEFFIRTHCKRGGKCMNIHSAQARTEYREEQKNRRQGGNSVAATLSATTKDIPAADGATPTTENALSVACDDTDHKLPKHEFTATSARDSCNNDSSRSNAPGTGAGNRRSNSSKLQLPPPYSGGARGTLWRKLIEDERYREENIVLQCLRFFVNNNFLQPAE